MRKKEKLLLATRINYIQILMSKDESIKKEIENGFKLFLENSKIEPDVNGLYYDKKLKINITPAIWGALYWRLIDIDNRKYNCSFDPMNKVFDKGTLGAAIVGRDAASGTGS